MPIPQSIYVSYRRSEEVEPGRWESLELGVTAMLYADESYEAIGGVYQHLADRHEGIWRGRRDTRMPAPQPTWEPPSEPPPEPAVDDARRWCAVHQCYAARRENHRGVWYSHRAPDGAWCNVK